MSLEGRYTRRHLTLGSAGSQFQDIINGTMVRDLINGTRLLGKGHIRHVRGDKGRRVELLSGSLWITQDGDQRDIVLGPGEAFAFDRHADALLSAFDDSRYVVLDACAPVRH